MPRDDRFTGTGQSARREGRLAAFASAAVWDRVFSVVSICALALVAVALTVDLVVIGDGSLVADPAAPATFSDLALHLALFAATGLLLWSLMVRKRVVSEERDEEFAEMSRRLELAMEVSQIGFWDVDLDKDLLRWDPRACALMGVPPRDGYFTEADWLGAVHPDDRDRAGATAHAAIEKSGHFFSDYRVVWSDGQVRHLRDMAAFYRGPKGAPRLAGLVWDVTADKEREAELELRQREAEAANIAKSNFLAAMSHEIRTPLAGVMGMLDLILSDPLSEPQAERARIASASAHSLLLLLNDVLDFSKLEAASITLAPAPTDPRRLVAEVTDLMAARAEQKGLAFETSVHDGVPACILVDPVRLRQVLTNVVSNAIAFTNRGRIFVRVRHDDRATAPSLCFEVEDTGVGISAADRERIFDRFVQADASSSRASGGTGLGLAIARELVGLMDGEIGVDSVLGEGSVFRFSVRAVACASPATAATGDAPPAEATTPLDVLVAEDNTTNRFLIESLLRKAGHRATLVSNGREAVDAAVRCDHDVILMDIQMPVMDGLAASRAIRALPAPAGETPIIALTASVLSDERESYQDAGMDSCLAKPIDMSALRAALSEIEPRRLLQPGAAAS